MMSSRIIYKYNVYIIYKYICTKYILLYIFFYNVERITAEVLEDKSTQQLFGGFHRGLYEELIYVRCQSEKNMIVVKEYDRSERI